MKITEHQKKSGNLMNRLTDAPLSPSAHNNEVEATRESDNVAGTEEPSLHNYDERRAVDRLGVPYCRTYTRSAGRRA